MKFLKNIFAFFIPLLCMLVAFSIFTLVNNVVINYKTKISQDYSIVIVAKKALDTNSIKTLEGIEVQSIQALKTDRIINNMKSNLSKNSIELLKQKLPYFYQLYLKVFPTSTQLENIKNNLLQNKDISKVEVFYKNHNQIYLLLLLINSITFILFFIITIFAIIIISKQIKLWFQEHSMEISILRLHGASIMYSAALLSTFLAFIVTSALVYYLYENIGILFPIELQEIVEIDINLSFEYIKLFLLAFLISMLTIFGVLLKYKVDND